jgi:quercetin dioxygenase-like cupin family protein
MKSDADVKNILQMDGVNKINIEEANKQVTHIPDLIEHYGMDSSWSHTVINSPSNSATLICQMPGEGNRRHYHPNWDEWWFIIEGTWLWEIEGVTSKIKKGDVVFIERNRIHKITAAGDTASIRLAVSRYDVDHVYSPNDYE